MAKERRALLHHAVARRAVHIVHALRLAPTLHSFILHHLLILLFHFHLLILHFHLLQTIEKRCLNLLDLPDDVRTVFFGVGVVERDAERKVRQVRFVRANHTDGHLTSGLLVRQLQWKRCYELCTELILGVRQGQVHGLARIAAFVGAFEVGERAAVHFRFHTLLKHLVSYVAVCNLFVDDTVYS